jgi:hypothetical protein
VRDGDPAALAALCDRRGPAVLAYCHHVAGDAFSVAAAAEAFGQFRAAVVVAADPASVNPEALLVNATRQAAARHAAIVAPGICSHVPVLLASRADRSISLANLDRLEEHLATCWTCRAPVSRFEAAERAYRDPPSTPVEPEAAAVIVAALTAAAPVRAEEPPPPEPTLPPLTAAAIDASATPAPPEPFVAADDLDRHTTEYQPIDHLDVDPGILEPLPEPAAPPRRARGAERAGTVAMLLGSLKGAGAKRAPADAEAAPRARPSAARGRKAPRAPREPRPPREPRAPRAASGAGAGTHLPRPQRATAGAGAGARRERPAGRSRRGLRPSLVLPIVLVAFALVIALFVAGVFGADDPTPSSGSVTPAVTPQPAVTTTPEVVEVPGAGDASGRAVELAKARARARRRRAAQTQSTTATPAAAPPPAVAAPAPVAAPPAAKPKPAAPKSPKTPASTGGAAGIDANNSATGAEQLPAAQDTSTVPELAPPADPAPAVPPG